MNEDQNMLSSIFNAGFERIAKLNKISHVKIDELETRIANLSKIVNAIYGKISPTDGILGTSDELSKEYVVDVDGLSIRFLCPSLIAYDRARWALEKEPETIAWINSFSESSSFWDIGANVGVYSLYASIVRKCTVIAVEPSVANAVGLNSNIRANRAEDSIKALCIALDRKPSIDYLNMQDQQIGAALHSFGSSIDQNGNKFKPQFRQGSLAVNIDSLCDTFGLEVPNYIKIDVDGLESQILSGGEKTLSNTLLRSLLVEVNHERLEEVDGIISIMERAGMMRDYSFDRRDAGARTTNVGNLIFSRNKT